MSATATLLAMFTVGVTAGYLFRGRLFRIRLPADEYAWGLGFGEPRRRRRKRIVRALRSSYAALRSIEGWSRQARIAFAVTLILCMATAGYFAALQAAPLLYRARLAFG